MAAGFRVSSRAHAPLKLVHDSESGQSDAISPEADRGCTDLHGGEAGDADAAGFRESSFCAFCASPMPASGEPCCADYAATIGQSAQAGVPETDGVAAPDFAAPQGLPVRAAPGEQTFAARYIPRPYVLLGLFGLLVCCVGVLALALMNQSQIAAERAQELAATRRLSEEMIALVKEAREAAKPAAAPELHSETTAAVSTGEVGAPPQAAPADAPPPLAPAALSIVTGADAASNSAAQATAATADLAPPLPSVAPVAPPAAIAVEAPSEPAVSAPAAPVAPEKPVEQVVVAPPEPAKPRKKAPRTVKAVAAKARAKAAEVGREPASVASADQPAKPAASSPKSVTTAQELASLPPARSTTVLPPRAPIASPWTKLARGMSHKQVRRLLGEPRSTEQLMTGEFWFYAEHNILGRGWVAFSDRGVVYEWLTP
jgi:hypothetical protein